MVVAKGAPFALNDARALSTTITIEAANLAERLKLGDSGRGKFGATCRRRLIKIDHFSLCETAFTCGRPLRTGVTKAFGQLATGPAAAFDPKARTASIIIASTATASP